MPNNGRGRGGGNQGGKNKRFVPLAPSEWMGNQARNIAEKTAPKIVQKPVTYQDRTSPQYQAQPQIPTPQWSHLAPAQNNLQQLQSLCHGEKTLEKAGYVREELTEEEIKSRLRCLRCSGKSTISSAQSFLIVCPSKTQVSPSATDQV